MQLTAETKREDWATYLGEQWELTRPHGGNDAVRNHWQKVLRMTATEWEQHRAEMLAADANPERQRAIRAMSLELLQKMGER